MIVEQPGKVTDRILLLGSKESCAYLLMGKEAYAIIGGGTTYITASVLQQLKDFHIEENRIQRLVILHSHFDHCGMVPFLKKRWPWVEVTASARAKELLVAPKVVESIRALNRLLLTAHGKEKPLADVKMEFCAVDVDMVVQDGDMVQCDDLTMEILEVPGHSSCSIAVYVPQEKAMFASDAGGIPVGDRIFTVANANFDQYLESLQKMARYDIDVYTAEHYGARTGDDAGRYLTQSMAAANELRRMMEVSLTRTKDVEKSIMEMTDLFMTWIPEGFMPREVIAVVAGQMVKNVAKQKQLPV
jgi:glyoxylase-like metal-dependent hydrolase (beta-lactamase superfamily II)